MLGLPYRVSESLGFFFCLPLDRKPFAIWQRLHFLEYPRVLASGVERQVAWLSCFQFTVTVSPVGACGAPVVVHRVLPVVRFSIACAGATQIG